MTIFIFDIDIIKTKIKAKFIDFMLNDFIIIFIYNIYNLLIIIRLKFNIIMK